ncbi:MAG: DAK2 domain-containing protein [Actinobacteria bacterium]|nr:DAK2 domain-containing protein [Actinomycetota bacterium]
MDPDGKSPPPARHVGAPVLDAASFEQTMCVYAEALRAHREAINRLNVYPVPDGDTGTNMALTAESVVDELGSRGGDDEMGHTCKAIAHGSLMGARGNSGVILSQILRGICAVMCEQPLADGSTFARALRQASDAAREAVMKPVEGTILTVVREAADAAEDTAGQGDDLLAVVEAARDRAAVALEQTPELLPVLKEAGVVDAGGAGLVLLFDSLLNVLDGRPLPEPQIDETHGVVVTADQLERVHAGGHGAGIADLRYEVMFFLEAPDDTVPAFKGVWAGIGDSIVVVGGDGLWNCHIHTDDIGASIEAALDCGRPRQIRVTDLLEQVEEERWVREAEAEPDAPPNASDPVTTAVVAVATGAGISRIFYSLGVQRIVKGGQTMNPSTAQLLEAVESAPADDVVILPNNKNIIPVAEQVDAQTAKTVRVVPTRGIAEGFASLLQYDPEASGHDNAKAMSEAAGDVVAGEVTRAVRESACELGPIAEGDWLGICRDGICSVAPGLDDACVELLDAIVSDDHEIVTIIEGDGATPAATRHMEVWLQEHRPGVSTEVHHGGQPLYPYLFGIE